LAEAQALVVNVTKKTFYGSTAINAIATQHEVDSMTLDGLATGQAATGPSGGTVNSVVLEQSWGSDSPNIDFDPCLFCTSLAQILFVPQDAR
jgi:hypothetical protein